MKGLVLLVCLAAAASAEDAIPQGFVKIETMGPVQIHMKNAKWTAKTEFQIKFAELQKALGEFWHDQNVLKAGGPDTKFEERQLSKVNLVLFDNEAERDDFFMKATPPDPLKPGRPSETVYLALVDGKVDKEGWVSLSRMMSRVYAWRGLYFGPPVWLDLGMAEYFAYTGRGVKAGDFEAFNAMVERLHEVGTRGAEKAIGETLSGNGEGWSKEDNDNAWCLCHLLMTECKNLAGDLWLIVANQQACASDRLNGVVSDSRKIARYQVERAFGGAENLQAAWDWHRDAIVKGNGAKLKKAPGSVRDATAFLVLNFTVTVASGNSVNCETSGFFAYSAPWPGPISIAAAVGDKKDRYAGFTEISGDRSDKNGTAARWKEKKMPINLGSYHLQVKVTWEPDGGGVYQQVGTRDIVIPNR